MIRSIQLFSILLFCACLFLSWSAYFIYIPFNQYIIFPLSISLISFFFDLKYYLLGVYKNNFFLFYLFILLLLLLSLTYTIAPEYGTLKTAQLSIWIILGFLNFSAIYKNFYFFVKVLLAFQVIFLGLLLGEYGNPLDYMTYVLATGDRLGSGIEDEISLNPIWVSRNLCMLIILLLYINTKNNLIKTLKILTIIICLIFSIAAGSKGVLISLFCAILVLKHKEILKNKVLIVISVFISIFTLISFVDNKYITNRFSITNRASTERIDFQNKVIDYTVENGLWIGNGSGSTGYIINGFDERGYPHNIFVEIFSDLGLLGTILFTILIVKILFTSTKYLYKKNNPALLLLSTIFIFYFINSNFSGDFPSNKEMFIFALLLIFSFKFYENHSLYFRR